MIKVEAHESVSVLDVLEESKHDVTRQNCEQVEFRQMTQTSLKDFIDDAMSDKDPDCHPRTAADQPKEETKYQRETRSKQLQRFASLRRGEQSSTSF